MEGRKKKVRIENGEEFDDLCLVGSCSRKEVRGFKGIGRENKKF